MPRRVGVQLPELAVSHQLMYQHRHLFGATSGQHTLTDVRMGTQHGRLRADHGQTVRHGIDQLGVHMLLK